MKTRNSKKNYRGTNQKREAVPAEDLEIWNTLYLDGDLMAIVRKSGLSYSTIQTAFAGLATTDVIGHINAFYKSVAKQRNPKPQAA